MFRFNKDQIRWWDFLVVMTNKEMRVKYKMTVFGFFWALLNPIMQMIIMGLVFQFFVPVKVDNYFIFLFSGLLPWNFVSSTVLRSTTIIINERSLVQKSKFPREILVLSVVLSNFIHLLISFGLLLVISLFSGNLSWGWFYLPLIVLPLVAMVSGISLLLAALNVRRRDVSFVAQVMIPLWFYISPILYTLDLLPEKYIWWFALNPLTGILDFIRAFLINVPIKNICVDFMSIIWCLILLVIGVFVFKRADKNFDEWI